MGCQKRDRNEPGVFIHIERSVSDYEFMQARNKLRKQPEVETDDGSKAQKMLDRIEEEGHEEVGKVILHQLEVMKVVNEFREVLKYQDDK
mmetsp:Transcript_33449/g.38412  ORF Transcript_33449/g.38412 Transcript_33449/m.38412 type:complete len:90 (+) Transcript_33449:66-335(+)|eukprot:CAMPEP_0168343226 /NCGR_PEP_ID=MMETSP0213-20121227/15935_1 /TAXON_ID=151035 /ORGANISM="Euplotes harpa, Strain FSP1.4" /LENGTH=89 /DNA_ID=CAMNT_0008350417 /DNA_START=50 /DNA_END=319 /DNA_ORIENTATION=+